MVSDTESGSDSSSGSISPSIRRRRSPHSPFSEHSRDNIVHDNCGDDDKSNLSAVSTGSATNSPMAIESQSKTDNNYGLRKKNCKRDNENVSEKKMNNLVDDLSDVSDSDNDDSHLSKYDLDVEVNSNDSVKSEKGNQDETNLCKKFQEKITKLEDTEEQLDFEAEDVDVTDVPIAPSCTTSLNSVGMDNCAKSAIVDSGEDNGEESDKKNDSNDGGDELEEGEVSDDDEARPEEVEPKPVCKFYSRGLCTWGMSCRFLHPGVMDKGNYTMFDIIRPAVPDIVPKSEERIAVGPNSTTGGTISSVETAWERGLRTAKEMVRRANKRKEQDSDFEEKKMTLTRSPEDTDKENGFYNRNSPDPPVPPMRHYPPIRTNLPPLPVPAHEYLPPPPPSRYTHDYYNRRFYFDDRPESDIIISRERGGIRTYREVPISRIPPHPAYYSKYNDELAIENALKRHGGPGNRSKREVILQRVDPSITMKNRVYDYPDPWVTRNKSPIKGRFSKSGHRKGSYSSQSSYSSSSSSSRSSSASSRSSYGKSRSKSLSPSRIRSSRRQKSSSPLPPPPVPQPQSSSSSSSQSKRTNRKYTSPQQSSSQQHSSISTRKAEIGRDSPMGQPNSRRPYKNMKPSSPQHRSSSNVLIKGDFDDSNRNRGDRKKTNLSTRNTTSVVTNTAPITNTTTAIKTSVTRKRALSRSSTASESSSSSSSTGSESSGSSSSSGRRKSPRNTVVSRSKHRTRSKRDRRLSETKKPQSPVLQSMSPPPLQLNLKRSIKLNLKPPNLKSPTPPPIQPPPQKKLLIIPDFCMPNEPESKTDSGKKTSLESNESLVGKKRSISSISSMSTPIVKDNDSSVSDVKSNINKSKASRREELLKQLKAVEDAIAKKRSKLS